MRDKIEGVLYGQWVGDALGIPYEYKPAQEVSKLIGEEDPIRYRDHHRPQLGHSWKAGECSDDTEQAIVLLRAIQKNPTHPCGEAALGIHRWLLENGRGSGGYTRRVVGDPRFRKTPTEVAKEVWEAAGKWAAPNGGVMRAGYIALMSPGDLLLTASRAKRLTQITHYDPRCVDSAVAVSVAISSLLVGATANTAVSLARDFCTQRESKLYLDKDLDDLYLDEGLPRKKGVQPQVGYTLKALGAAFWALREAADYPKGEVPFASLLEEIILSGGDTDTNAAVAGALLGALIGKKGIPKYLLDLPEEAHTELEELLNSIPVLPSWR